MTYDNGARLGRYVIVEHLGNGVSAEVYRAVQDATEQEVALKVLRRQVGGEQDPLARFRLEARVFGRLTKHPNILTVHDYGECGDETFLVVQYLPGGTLKDRLERDREFPRSSIRKLVAQIGSALDYAHAGGVIHRDVKPANILIDAQGNFVLTDFGVAKLAEDSPLVTHQGTTYGTAAYMSPEQACGDDLTGKSDIYSLGCIVFELLAGRTPFDAPNPQAMMAKQVTEPASFPPNLESAVPEVVRQVVLRCLAKDPTERYDSAELFLEALDAAYRSPGRPRPVQGLNPQGQAPGRNGAAGQVLSSAKFYGSAVAAGLLLGLIGWTAIPSADGSGQGEDRLPSGPSAACPAPPWPQELTRAVFLDDSLQTDVLGAAEAVRRHLVRPAERSLPGLYRAAAATAVELPEGLVDDPPALLQRLNNVHGDLIVVFSYEWNEPDVDPSTRFRADIELKATLLGKDDQNIFAVVGPVRLQSEGYFENRKAALANAVAMGAPELNAAIEHEMEAYSSRIAAEGKRYRVFFHTRSSAPLLATRLTRALQSMSGARPATVIEQAADIELVTQAGQAIDGGRAIQVDPGDFVVEFELYFRGDAAALRGCLEVVLGTGRRLRHHLVGNALLLFLDD